MAARSIKLDGPVIVVLFYDDETSVTISGVSKLDEQADGTLQLWHGDTFSKVRPTYRFYQIRPDSGEEESE